MRHPAVLGHLDLLYHLPGDGLQRGQRQENLSEATARVVLAVADVVLQIDLETEFASTSRDKEKAFLPAHLYLVSEPFDLVDIEQSPGVGVEEDDGLETGEFGVVYADVSHGGHDLVHDAHADVADSVVLQCVECLIEVLFSEPIFK